MTGIGFEIEIDSVVVVTFFKILNIKGLTSLVSSASVSYLKHVE